MPVRLLSTAHVPDNAAVGGLDDHRVQRGDEIPVGVLEVRSITEISAHARSPFCGTNRHPD
jgi:hypothetical protein